MNATPSVSQSAPTSSNSPSTASFGQAGDGTNFAATLAGAAQAAGSAAKGPSAPVSAVAAACGTGSMAATGVAPRPTGKAGSKAGRAATGGSSLPAHGNVSPAPATPPSTAELQISQGALASTGAAAQAAAASIIAAASGATKELAAKAADGATDGPPDMQTRSIQAGGANAGGANAGGVQTRGVPASADLPTPAPDSSSDGSDDGLDLSGIVGIAGGPDAAQLVIPGAVMSTALPQAGAGTGPRVGGQLSTIGPARTAFRPSASDADPDSSTSVSTPIGLAAGGSATSQAAATAATVDPSAAAAASTAVTADAGVAASQAASSMAAGGLQSTNGVLGTGGLATPGLSAATVVSSLGAAASAQVAQAAAAMVTAGSSEKHSHAGSDSALDDSAADAAAGAAQLGAVATSSADAAPAPTLKVSAGVETPAFAQGVTDHVAYMVDTNLNAAKLQVNPPQLGPIEVRISLQGDHAQVWLASHSAVTREALESSSSKLREMLGSQGFGQVSVDVSQRHFQERPAQSQAYDYVPTTGVSQAAAAVQSGAASTARNSNGVLDAYA